MGSSMRRVTVFMVIVIVAAILGVVVYTNRSSLKETEEADASATVSGMEENEDGGEGAELTGTDTRAFLEDETFFNPDKKPYSSIEKMEEKNLSLLMTSVQKDLRIQVVDNAGKLVTGVPFCVVLNGDKEYTDEDEDGVIYIEHLRAGQYEASLKEVEGYRIPDSTAGITVKQSVEYAVIDDISLLIFSEEDVDAALEDLEVKGAAEDADKSEITKLQSGNANAKIGIDVSKWNKEIDWDKVKSAGVEFAIIRVGYRGASTGKLIEDPYFADNMKGAAQAGIPVGVYFFTQAVDPVEAVEEASMVLSLCREYKITYPMFIDTEGAGGSGRADNLSVEERTQICKAFCTTIENSGYTGGVYGARNWLNGKLTMSELENYTVWLAEYKDVPVYQGYYHMWQYTSGGSVDGIAGRVDLNLSYLDIGTEESSSAQDNPGDTDHPDAENNGKTAEDVTEQEIIEPKVISGVKNADY